VKVNPKDVEDAGFLWKAMYDWKLAVPAALLVAMPLWMTGNLPGFDERLELSLITILAGTAISKEVGPMFKAMKEKALETKNKCVHWFVLPPPFAPLSTHLTKFPLTLLLLFYPLPHPTTLRALYEAEAGLNKEIERAIEVFRAGQSIPETMKMVHSGERALAKLEASAATLRAKNALRDATVAELDYLVQLKTSAAGETGGAVSRAATAATVSAFEKDAGLQQKSIESAIKALSSGSWTLSEDIVAPTYKASLAAAKAEVSAKPASNPFKSAAQRETFDKRFGYGAGGKVVSPGNTISSPFTLAK